MCNYVTGDCSLALLAAVAVGLFIIAAALSYLGCCLACRCWLSLRRWARWEE